MFPSLLEQCSGSHKEKHFCARNSWWTFFTSHPKSFEVLMLILRKADLSVIYQPQISWPLQDVAHVYAYAFCIMMFLHFDSYSSEDTNVLVAAKVADWRMRRNKRPLKEDKVLSFSPHLCGALRAFAYLQSQLGWVRLSRMTSTSALVLIRQEHSVWLRPQLTRSQCNSKIKTPQT